MHGVGAVATVGELIAEAVAVALIVAYGGRSGRSVVSIRVFCTVASLVLVFERVAVVVGRSYGNQAEKGHTHNLHGDWFLEM